MLENIRSEFETFLTTQLNQPQYDAVVQKNGALLVIAGAGSGKTRVITSRIINLILREEVSPSSIVALTFTNKAAGEMKERITKVLGVHHQLPFVGTFHSYCLLLLRSNPTLLPFPQFSILDADDQLSIIKKIIKKNSLEKQVTPSQIIHQISNIKNKSHLSLQTNDESLFPNQLVKEIYYAYETEKATAHAFDFDDLIINVLQLFKKEPFKESFQRRIKHLLVDEYQDTSHAQHQLLLSMALNQQKEFVLDSVCAVGDEDQSIYSWRGATVANMLKFQKDFSPTTKIKIEQNYRSVQQVLDAANSLIACNKLRNPKKLWSEKKAKNRILVLSCRSGEQEAEAIARFIQSLPTDKKLSLVAILYRTHFQSRNIEEALIYHSIPYHIVGGIRFYERKEIKDLLAYLRLIVFPFDKISLLRIINCPSRGLGQKFEELLFEEWNQNPFFTFSQLLEHLCTSPESELTPAKKLALQNFLALYQGLDNEQSITYLIDTIIEKVDYINYLRTSFDAREAEAKIENVRELVQSINHFEQKFTEKKNTHLSPDDPFYVQTNKPTLENFLYEVALLQEKTEKDQREDQVQMMTLHAAKGLEFDTVIITGLEEGILPSSKSLTTNEELEEERRLFYVGITRACHYLLLSHASYRSTYGSIVDQIPSRFLDEIDTRLLQKHDGEKLHSMQFTTLFKQWLGNKDFDSGLVTFSSATLAKKTTPSPTQHAPAKIEAKPTAVAWIKDQRVIHKAFGPGIITQVEKASDSDYYITAIFKAGKKKVLSSFLEKI